MNGKILKLVYPKDQYLTHLYSTFYCINKTTDYVTKSLEELSIPLLSCFKENKLKLNLDNSHLIVSGTENTKINWITLP